MATVIGQAAPEREALPPPALDDAAFAALVLDAQASLAEGVEKAGLGRDPYRFLMGALSQALGVLPAFMGKLDGAIDHARQPVDPVALERSMVLVVERLERAAARGVNQHMLAMVRAHNLRTLLLYGGAFVAAVLVALGGGFWWGQASANGSVHETEARLAQAFQAGPGAAVAWANLIQWNDINGSLASCKSDAGRVEAGRRACAVPLWIEPPSQTVPTRYR